MQLSYAKATDPLATRLVIRGVERILGTGRIQWLYDRLPELPSHRLWEAALDALEIELRLSGTRLEDVPRDGALVVIANHPFGVVDGLALCALSARLRPDFRIVANSVICKDERMQGSVLPIDFEETRAAMRVNVETKRRALALLAEGGALAIFPSGGVATAPRGIGAARDLEWKTFVAKLVRSSRSTVLPIFFPGQNGRTFQIVSQFSASLRLALLLPEALRRRRRPLPVTIGRPLAFSELEASKGREALTARLREAVFALREGPSSPEREDSYCQEGELGSECASSSQGRQ